MMGIFLQTIECSQPLRQLLRQLRRQAPSWLLVSIALVGLMDINVRLDELFARNLVPRGPYQALIQTEIWRSRAGIATGITSHREEEAEKGATLGIDSMD
jgi:hypothetical protein